MKIQPNFVTRSYNQPAFSAGFSKDPETTEILKSAVNAKDETTPLWLYRVLKALENMNSEDTISLKRNVEENKCAIINDRIGRKIEIFMKSPENCGFGMFGVNLPQAIFMGFGLRNEYALHEMFEDASYKDENGYTFDIDKIEENPEDYNINNGNARVDSQIYPYKSENIRYRAKIKENEDAIQKLEASKIGNERKYVLSLIA